jgi:hypothetical protein
MPVLLDRFRAWAISSCSRPLRRPAMLQHMKIISCPRLAAAMPFQDLLFERRASIVHVMIDNYVSRKRLNVRQWLAVLIGYDCLLLGSSV